MSESEESAQIVEKVTQLSLKDSEPRKRGKEGSSGGGGGGADFWANWGRSHSAKGNSADGGVDVATSASRGRRRVAKVKENSSGEVPSVVKDFIANATAPPSGQASAPRKPKVISVEELERQQESAAASMENALKTVAEATASDRKSVV